MTPDSKDLDKTVKLIDCLGLSNLAEEIGLTPQAIFQWKKYGIPKAWMLYLKDHHSHEYKTIFGE